MSKYLPSQLHYLGSHIKNKLNINFDSDELKEWCKLREISDYELEFIKQGYEGRALQATQLETIMPFGKLKGRKLIDVPTDYLEWCLKSDWISGWGNLDSQIKQVLRERNTGLASQDDIKTLLKKIE